MSYRIVDELGKRIKDFRERKGVTQQELAEKAELSLPFINLIENSKRSVSLETLVKITIALDISLSDFFKPYSVGNEDELAYLIELIQTSSHKKDYIEMFTKILEYEKK